MGTFYFTIITTYLSGYVSRISKNRKLLSYFYVFLVFIVMFLLSAFRNDIGDTSAYKHSYSLYENYKFNMKGDWGFNLFQYVLYQIDSNPMFLLIVTSLITVAFNVYNMYHYCSFLELEVYMYITSGYFTTTMNGIRQSMVAAIVFSFTRIIEKGNTKLFILFIILASPFHQSVLILIPIYFILRSEPWSKTTLFIIIISCVGFLGFSKLFPALLGMLDSSNYGVYAETNMGGSSFMRVIVNAVPVVLAFIKRKELKESWAKSNIFVNMALINVIFVAFGMHNWIFNRFTIYFQLYNFVLVPYIIKNCFKGKERRLLYVSFMLCYFIFFYYEQVIGLNMKYDSEYLNFKRIFYK